jgi:hypothetical protein
MSIRLNGDCTDGDGTLYVGNDPGSGFGWVSEYALGKTTALRIITQGITGRQHSAQSMHREPPGNKLRRTNRYGVLEGLHSSNAVDAARTARFGLCRHERGGVLPVGVEPLVLETNPTHAGGIRSLRMRGGPVAR